VLQTTLVRGRGCSWRVPYAAWLAIARITHASAPGTELPQAADCRALTRRVFDSKRALEELVQRLQARSQVPGRMKVSLHLPHSACCRQDAAPPAAGGLSEQGVSFQAPDSRPRPRLAPPTRPRLAPIYTALTYKVLLTSYYRNDKINEEFLLYTDLHRHS